MNSQINNSNNKLKQHAISVWLVGLSGAGKTTLANKLKIELIQSGFLVQTLDGDKVRTGINKDLGFTEIDRIENIRRIAEISKLFLNCNIITINSFICPTEEIREVAKNILGENNFYLIYINAPIEICEQRDPKGLYKKARRGDIKNFTGIDAVFEPPAKPFLEIKSDQLSIDKSIEIILASLFPLIKK